MASQCSRSKMAAGFKACRLLYSKLLEPGCTGVSLEQFVKRANSAGILLTKEQLREV